MPDRKCNQGRRIGRKQICTWAALKGFREKICEEGFLAMEQETTPPGYEEGFVEVAGARVYYLHAGSGKPMLLIHGLVGSSANWRNNIDAFAQHSSVYAIDLVNMGKSQRVGGLDAGLVATARRIVSFMDALNIPQADIVAHSHGGAVALMLAALRPRRVRKLVLFAPANPYSRTSDVMVRVYSTRWGAILASMLPYLPRRIQRIALGEMYGGSSRILDRHMQEIVDGLHSSVTLRHVLCVIRSWRAEMANLEIAIRRLKRMRMPTLLVWGDRDFTISLSSAFRLNRKLRASELIVLPGAGHSVFEEKPEESNRIVLEWLGRDSSPHPRLRELPRTAPVAEKTVPATGKASGNVALQRLSPGIRPASSPQNG
jgi:pimeloyl-ACP methyl ester carboxylesterase